MQVFIIELVEIKEGYHFRKNVKVYKDFVKAVNEKDRLNSELGYKDNILNGDKYYLVWSYELEEK